MTEPRVALVALLRHVGFDAPGAAAIVEDAGLLDAPDPRRALAAATATSAATATAEPSQPDLFSAPAPPPDLDGLLAAAAADQRAWDAAGLALLTVVDADYPANLRAVHDRPAAVLVAGRLTPAEATAIAVVGTRHPSPAGEARAAELTAALAAAGVTIVSGLAAGIDTVAHTTALAAGARTLAVIGTGHGHAYPPGNAALQRRLAAEQAVVSPFPPDAPPSADRFRRRNGVMSGISRGTLIVEATPRSGTRVQARLALGHNRPVFLDRPLTDQAWARELARRPGVHVVDGAAEILAVVEALDDVRPPEP